MSLARIWYVDVDGLTKTPYITGVTDIVTLESQLPVFYRVTNAAITKIRFSPDGYIQQNPHIFSRREYIEPTYTDIDFTNNEYPTRTEPGHIKTEIFATVLLMPTLEGYTRRYLTIPSPRNLLLDTPPNY